MSDGGAGASIAVKSPQRSTGSGGYFGRPGARQFQNVEPRRVTMAFACAQRSQSPGRIYRGPARARPIADRQHSVPSATTVRNTDHPAAAARPSSRPWYRRATVVSWTAK